MEERYEDIREQMSPSYRHRVVIQLQPVTLKEAQRFVADRHRHHKPPQGGLFAIGCNDGQAVVGVVIVGRPNARLEQDGYTCEVTRLATDGSKNACSMLYRAAWRAARAMGYRRLVTRILASEPGTSLIAAGFTCKGPSGGGSWSRLSRPRVDAHPIGQKVLWELVA